MRNSPRVWRSPRSGAYVTQTIGSGGGGNTGGGGGGGGGSSTGTPIDLHTTDFLAYCRLGGDNYYTIPAGYYKAGTLNDLAAKHAATNGPYGGYLILEAPTPGSVIVDLGPPGLPIAGGGGVTSNGDFLIQGSNVGGHASGIIFSGIKFQNGHVMNTAHNIHFWYTEHTFPWQNWAAESGRSTASSYHNDNTTLFFGFGCVTSYGLGLNIHHAGSGITLQGGCRFLDYRGFTINNIDDGGDATVDVVDNVHPDCLCMLGGNIWNHSFSDFDIVGSGTATGVQFQNLSGTWNGGSGTWTADDCENLTFARGWVHDCYSGGFTIESFRSMSGKQCLVSGTLTDIHVWGNGRANNAQNQAAYQYKQGVDTNTEVTYTIGANPQPLRLNFTATNCSTLIDKSVGGTVASPAATWQAAHPFTSLVAFFTGLGWPNSVD